MACVTRGAMRLDAALVGVDAGHLAVELREGRGDGGAEPAQPDDEDLPL